MARHRMIQPYLEPKRYPAMVADDADVCVRSAQDGYQYRKRGLVALVRKSRDDRGARGGSDLHVISTADVEAARESFVIGPG
jgi:hypothetical protein